MIFDKLIVLAIFLLSFNITLALKCGKKNNIACPTGYCCSEDGECGKSIKYCGIGCQPEYGDCLKLIKRKAGGAANNRKTSSKKTSSRRTTTTRKIDNNQPTQVSPSYPTSNNSGNDNPGSNQNINNSLINKPINSVYDVPLMYNNKISKPLKKLTKIIFDACDKNKDDILDFDEYNVYNKLMGEEMVYKSLFLIFYKFYNYVYVFIINFFYIYLFIYYSKKLYNFKDV